MPIAIARFAHNVRPMLVALLLAAWVALQAFALHHQAEHHFEAHKHHGHVCAAHDFCDNLVFSDAVPTPRIPVVLLPVDVPATVLFSVHETPAVAAALPRAPPAAV